jgi:UDPglucose 6-dehydrogenase
MKTGVIGRGFVGDAVYQNMPNTISYDLVKEKSDVNSLKELCDKCRVIYVCLPTPMNKDGSSNTKIIQKVMSELDNVATNKNIFILKSTVPPGTCNNILSNTKNINLVFSPEFLTEANYLEDFKKCNRVIFGGENNLTSLCVEHMMLEYPNKKYIQTDHKTAETIKYFTNNFLSVKISFANEMKQVCDAINISYDEVKSIALLDNRISNSHLTTPGPDGDCGFGGTCFPKDINAMINFADSVGVDCKVLKATWEKNLEVRNKKDWLTMFGRAVSLEND